MANPVTPDGTDTFPMSACQDCNWRGPDTELREIKDLYQRVEPGEPMPSGACPECGALCQPTEDDGTTKPVRVRVACTADVQEVWLGNAPAYLDGNELHDWCDEELSRGNLTFDTQEVDGERDREIVDIEVLVVPIDRVLGSVELATLKEEIKDALEGDSNDAEHDALAAVAAHFDIEWEAPDA
jgi:hypothetical protein